VWRSLAEESKKKGKGEGKGKGSKGSMATATATAMSTAAAIATVTATATAATTGEKEGTACSGAASVEQGGQEKQQQYHQQQQQKSPQPQQPQDQEQEEQKQEEQEELNWADATGWKNEEDWSNDISRREGGGGSGGGGNRVNLKKRCVRWRVLDQMNIAHQTQAGKRMYYQFTISRKWLKYMQWHACFGSTNRYSSVRSLNCACFFVIVCVPSFRFAGSKKSCSRSWIWILRSRASWGSGSDDGMASPLHETGWWLDCG
jgi:hypothetical protein